MGPRQLGPVGPPKSGQLAQGGANCPGSCGPYGPIRTIWTQSANQCSACVTSCEHMKCDSVVFIFASNCSHQRSCSCRLCKYFTNCVSFCPFSESVVLQISYLWPLHMQIKSGSMPCQVAQPPTGGPDLFTLVHGNAKKEWMGSCLASKSWTLAFLYYPKWSAIQSVLH